FFFSSRRRHTRCYRDWSSDVCSSDLLLTSPSVPGSLGHADAESFQKTVRPRRGDDHSVAVLHPFGPAQIETTLGEGGAYRARDRSEERRVGKERRRWQAHKK